MEHATAVPGKEGGADLVVRVAVVDQDRLADLRGECKLARECLALGLRR